MLIPTMVISTTARKRKREKPPYHPDWASLNPFTYFMQASYPRKNSPPDVSIAGVDVMLWSKSFCRADSSPPISITVCRIFQRVKFAFTLPHGRQPGDVYSVSSVKFILIVVSTMQIAV